MYPSLPAVSSTNDVNGGYPAPVSSAPNPTLGTNFEESRRYVNVPVLRRAKPGDVEMTNYTEEEPEAPKTAQEGVADSMIDPSLGAFTSDTSASAQDAQVEKSYIARDSELIVSLHNYVKKLLVEHEDRVKNGETEQQQADQEMTDAPDTEKEAAGAQEQQQTQEQTDAQALYPILKAVAAC